MLNLEHLEVEPHQMVHLKQHWIWFLMDSMQLLYFLPLKQLEVFLLLLLYSLKILVLGKNGYVLKWYLD